ncbi:MAG: flavodoxin family protein [Anaerolineae bacterium]|nr:flavodoxin family protein [Anaerolineae bacterium]
MKITFICGSNRRNGNTDAILEMLTGALAAKAGERGMAVESEVIHLGSKRIEMCSGCRACFERGEAACPHKDDIASLAASMQACDLLVFASPVYVDDVSGLMKNFIDRLAYFCHRPGFAGKPAYVIATTGSSSAARAIRTLQTALITWGFHLSGAAGFVMGARMQKTEAKERFGKKIGGIASRLLRELEASPTRQPSLLDLVVFQIQKKAWLKAGIVDGKETYDYRYWKDNGWFDPSCSYFSPAKVNPLLNGLARLAGGIAGLFI